uniref:Exophilin 5 n=1 Tax=Panagrolaimus sp. PS1159 TaxID=55785 RepID=A0AC35GSS7_9BILA
MSTKDGFLFLKNNQQSFVNDISQTIVNLNLNQNNKNPILIPVQSCSKPYYNNNFVCNNYEKKEKLPPWSKSSKISKFTTQNNTFDKEASKNWNKESSSGINDSTLSLHIAAYENSVEAAVPDSIYGKNDEGLKKRKSGTNKKCENTKQVSTTLTFGVQNSFEFPRQQSDKITESEVCQFKASQQLINPKKPLGNDRQKNNKYGDVFTTTSFSRFKFL